MTTNLIDEKHELLHLEIKQYGNGEGKIALVIDGFTKQEHVDFVLAQFRKFMADAALEIMQ